MTYSISCHDREALNHGEERKRERERKRKRKWGELEEYNIFETFSTLSHENTKVDVTRASISYLNAQLSF